MNTFFRFFYEFFAIFIEGLKIIIGGLFKGIGQIFNISEYAKIIGSYKDSFNGPEKFFVYVAIIVLIIVILLVCVLIGLYIKKLLRRATNRMNREELLNEIGSLNDQVRKLMKEKHELMSMKVSQLGVKQEDGQK